MVSGQAARPFDADRFAAAPGDAVPGGPRRAGRGHRAAVPLLRGLRPAPGHPGRVPHARRASWTRRCCWPWTRSARSSASPWTCGWPTPPVRACASWPSPTAWASSAKAGERTAPPPSGTPPTRSSCRASRTAPCWKPWPTCAARWAPAEKERRVQVQAVPPAFVSQLLRAPRARPGGGSQPRGGQAAARVGPAVLPPPPRRRPAPAQCLPGTGPQAPTWKTRPRPGWTAPGPWTGSWNPPGHPTCPAGRSRTERRTIRRDRPQRAR